MATRNDPSVWMWAEACDLIDEADRLHRRFFRLGGSGRDVPTWEPPVDVFEDEREIVLVVAMPGVAAERVQVASEPGVLVVRGVRPLPLRGLAPARAPARDPLRDLRAAHPHCRPAARGRLARSSAQGCL